jgi:erythromycin esterase
MQRKLAVLLVTCCFVELTCAQSTNQGTSRSDEPIIQWIAANAVRLKTPEAGHGFDDMKPLKKMIGNARIVSLGEATHGTREFFQLKHRMMEFLASEMGFTIFSIEANMPEAYRLNDYVLNGVGDPAKLLKGMYFWTWDTQEVLAMIHWMREFNKSGKGRVQFTGFDMRKTTMDLWPI